MSLQWDEPDLSIRHHHFPDQPGNECRELAHPYWRCADLEVPVLVHRLLHNRPIRSPRRLYDLRCRHGQLHDSIGSGDVFWRGEPCCSSCCWLFHLSVQHLRPYRLPRCQLLVLHRGRPHPAPHGYVFHLDCKPLALVSQHTQGPPYQTALNNRANRYVGTSLSLW